MRYLILSTLLMLSAGTASSYVEKLDKIKEEDRKIIDQVKLEKGGHIVFEQYLAKKESYNGQDSYRLELICDKGQPKKEATCKIISYEILKQQTR
jgi:hypothetical protein